MIARRDLLIVCVALGVGIGIGRSAIGQSAIGQSAIGQLAIVQPASAQSQPPVQESALFDWNSISVKPTEVGQFRQFLRGRTATLDELEIHATTLNPGQASHPPHKHPNEELVILASGKLEATSNGQVRQLGPGSVIFNASNQMHSVRNIGDVPATYHVINWTSPGHARSDANAVKPKP